MSITAISTASSQPTSSYSTLPYFDPEKTSNDFVESLFSVTESSEMPEYHFSLKQSKIPFPSSLNPYSPPQFSPHLSPSSHGAQISSTISNVSSSILKKRSSSSSFSTDSSVQFSSKNESRKKVRFTQPSLSSSSSSSMDSTSFSSTVPLKCKDIGCICSDSRLKSLIVELNELMMFRGMVSSTGSSRKALPLMTFHAKAKETPYGEAVRCLGEVRQKMADLRIEVCESSTTSEEVRKIKIGQYNFLLLVANGLKLKQKSLTPPFPCFS